MVCWGVDHATGTFCQVWAQPHDEQDEPLVTIDNLGVRSIAKALKPEVNAFLNSVKARFQAAKAQGNFYPNVDEETVAQLFAFFGFHHMRAEIHVTFD